ncbi:DUF2778 domain-containing protein [Burkholderia gladioli]|uniref:DUF2778 domain-containing protein n=1 Tax=Burkholderia gladioli TaxID=28095 RepID=UPI00163FEA6A|nr:DUF2778 domain-containing protein [Burkholderia gladioli]
MPVECSFILNKQPISTLHCPGLGHFSAFSGNGLHTNNPESVTVISKGPLPKGVYYIVDRESGGHLGWLRDVVKDMGNNTHRADWFALYRNDGKIDVETIVNGIRRAHFRLHPIGSRRISNGCITLPSVSQFATLRAFLKSQPMFDVLGTKLKAYGRVTVK